LGGRIGRTALLALLLHQHLLPLLMQLLPLLMQLPALPLHSLPRPPRVLAR
jgi:hypothetical protein